MTTDFKGRIAFVTGAAGAIGSALVTELRRLGAHVVAADGASGRPWTQADLRTEHLVRLNVTDRSSIRGLVSRTEAQLGPIDLLINVAGVVSFGSAEALSELEWDRVIDINLKGSFMTCQAVIPGMKRAGFGRIINLGSVVGKNAGNPRPWMDPTEQQRAGNVAYGVSKAGIHAMTGFLAKELAAYGITVNAVAPGPIATAMTTSFPATLQAMLPVGRMGSAGDVVTAILFLASQENSFITGEVLDVNGGMWCD
ncbi:SDR family NAD(P)-dependent oxidoreductase [Bordetella avium]|uniref:N-acylmannosamine 1-dehydrogenase (Short-chain dehydrogenase/reductase) n=1 Tax=Bordetella avium (strain 197N) TaxID=360910 RepID=Q2KTZ3_BORA1|nr:SDR family NAD(P)-dependent oxidoreductase [Bordetella avium]AZY53979.1 NAD(P)-dependent oxidoreductase [Bordetella avium]RIQ15250.1 SDR family oxidoreductase [Bordetella avium]RIQ19946.1 SDR family oxidoreductase [Bordetella avium]RIQ38639.1 SDR family oxidoreductase [Bordetella avium]RIQ43179.1 SDR family oxidoreductase [Bordetella avium]